MSTPARGTQGKTPVSKSSGPRQQSILGFFQKKSDQTPLPSRPTFEKPGTTSDAAKYHPTPVPSSDPPEIPSSSAPQSTKAGDLNKENGLLTPATNSSAADAGVEFDDSDGSPVRKVSVVAISTMLLLSHSF
jgi:DNA mismatch repair protein MSH6